MLVLADPIFSREQCSPGNLCMRRHAAPPIERWHRFGGSAPNFFGLQHTLTRNLAEELT